MTDVTEAELLTISEIAALLRLKVPTIRAWLLQRRVPFMKLERRVWFASFFANVPRRVRPNREEGHEQVKTEVSVQA